MKTIANTTAAIAAILLLFPNSPAKAAEWKIFGKETAIGAVVVATVPVGEWVTFSQENVVTISLESISGNEVTLRSKDGNVHETGIPLTAAVGKTLIVRPPSFQRYPAIHIKILSVDAGQGTARLEVSQFWPHPKGAQIDKQE
jgi:hypothetical protein